jgi:DNA-binding NtrC family response regulator
VRNGADLAGCRVLIVEDESLLGMELEALLKEDGCEVLGPASTVEWALDLIYEGELDLALLDVNLKGVRATPVAAALRDRGIPFVVVTGYSRAQTSEPELRTAPRVDKPVDCRDLRRAVAQALEAAESNPKS